MRALLLLATAWLLLCVDSFSQDQNLDYTFGYRIGSSFSADELHYFGLYQIGKPDSVAFGRDSINRFQLKPFKNGQQLRSLTLSKSAELQFKSLIVSYEQYAQDPRNISFAALQGIDIHLPLIKHEQDGIYIEAASHGKAYIGEVVACTQGKLAIFDASTDYIASEAQQHLIILNISEIDTIETRVKGLAKYVGAATGLAAGISLYAFQAQLFEFEDDISHAAISFVALPAIGYMLGSVIDVFSKAERLYRPSQIEKDRSSLEKYLGQKAMFSKNLPPELDRAMQIAK